MNIIRWLNLIFDVILTLILIFDRISIHLSKYINSYFEWLVIESIIVIFILWTLGYIFKIPTRLKIKYPKKYYPIKMHPFKIVLYIILISLPFVSGVFWFNYNYTWRYTWNQFSDNEIGILIADYREVLLKDYIPQKKYSNYLKEILPELIMPCNEDFKISFKNTPAFVINRTEAVNLGKKVNAKAIIWGEVFKNDKSISIRQRIVTRQNFEIAIGDESLSLQQYINESHVVWSPEKSLAPLYSMPPYINDLLMFVAYSEMKTRNVNRQECRDYLLCCLQNSDNTMYYTRAFLLYDLAQKYQMDSIHDSAMIYFKESMNLLITEKQNIETRRIMAIVMNYIAEQYILVNQLDSAMKYVKSSFSLNPLLIYEDTKHLLRFYSVYISNKNYEEALEILVPLWQNHFDTISGDLIIDTYRGMRQDLNAQFRKEFETKFPGRIENTINGMHNRLGDENIYLIRETNSISPAILQ